MTSRAPTTITLEPGATDFYARTLQILADAQVPKRMIDLIHSAGAKVFHHNDGAILRILPDMVEAGIDILNPIQWRCRDMDRKMLKERFGKKLVFHGGMDNQETLAFGTVADVRREAEENIAIFGHTRFILAPCHNIQAVSPPENIVAMYETGYQLGWQQ